LYDRSPYNVIRLILNQEWPTDTEQDNRYTRAAAYLRDWLAEDVLKQDSARALYVYHQDFEVEGKTHTRRGFLARVRLEPFGSGRIYPHDETMSGPKAGPPQAVRGHGHEPQPRIRPLPRPGQRGHRAPRRRRGPGPAAPGDRPPRRRQQAVAGDRPGHGQRRDWPAQRQAGVHRR